MTMNPHTAAAIAQLIFYIPVVPLSIYLLIRNWQNRPRMAWYPPVPFSTSMARYPGLTHKYTSVADLSYSPTSWRYPHYC
jgi:hypothetical protein